MIQSLPQPVVFAHRGASAHAPENTLAAFQLALDQGAPAIEFDVKLTADGRVAVIHDPTLNRTTNGTGRVSQLPFAALQELDAGSWLSARFRGEKIPSLDQVFETFGKKLLMNVELTNYDTPFDALVPTVAALIKKHGLENYVWFSSFFPHNLMRMAQLLPSIPRGQLIWPGAGGWWQRAWGGWIDVQAEHPWKEDVNPAYVASVHARHRRVHAWTANISDDLRYLQALGIDGVFSDDPAAALEILRPS